MSYDKVASVAKCPKCRGTTLSIREFSVAMTDFEQEDGVLDREGYHSSGHITGLEMTCGCGHRWRPRGVAQVTDLEVTARSRRRRTGGGR